MSWQAVEAVLKFSQSKGSARLLLLCIAHHAGPDGSGARVALPTLEAESKIDRRHIQRHTKELEELGELLKQSGGGRASSTYSVLLPMPRLTSHGSGATGGSTGHGSGAASATAHTPPVQDTVVVSDVVVKNKQTTGAAGGRLELLEALEAEGVARSVAFELATDAKYSQRIPLQLACLDDREPNDRAATLVASIKNNWSPPKPYMERREATARHAAERSQREREEATKVQVLAESREREAELEAEKADMDAKYLQLSEAEQAEVDAQVLDRLGVIGRQKSAAGAIEATRRLVMKERGEA